jgi:hypothetical protein
LKGGRIAKPFFKLQPGLAGEPGEAGFGMQKKVPGRIQLHPILTVTGPGIRIGGGKPEQHLAARRQPLTAAFQKGQSGFNMLKNMVEHDQVILFLNLIEGS